MSLSSPDEPLFDVDMLRFSGCGPYSFSLHRGCCTGLSGPSGIGKTLLLRALADIDPSEGVVRLNGRVRSSYLPHEWRRLVAMVPAESRWWHPRVADHFPAAAAAGPVPDLLRACGFDEDVCSWQVSRLSTGEKQRLSLVRALAREPAVLLLDEAGSGLDAENGLLLEALVSSYLAENGSAAIWVSHNREQLGRVATVLIKMRPDGLQVETAGSGRPQWLRAENQ